MRRVYISLLLTVLLLLVSCETFTDISTNNVNAEQFVGMVKTEETTVENHKENDFDDIEEETKDTLSLEDFYISMYSEEAMALVDDEVFLQEGEEPLIYYTSDLLAEIDNLQSKYYTGIGYLAFNSGNQNYELIEDSLRKIAIEKGAKIVIYNQEYTSTENLLFVSIDKFDYTACFFVMAPSDAIWINRLGFLARNLQQKERVAYKRNTGVLINTVLEKSPAYYANLIKNDIVIKINGMDIIDLDSYFDAMAMILKYPTLKTVKISFIRDGVLQSAEIRL